MCGACGRTATTDEWSSLLATRHDGWEATRLINAALATGGHPARLTCLSGPWVVRSHTGVSLVAECLSEVWQHCRTAGAIPEETLTALEMHSRSPVATAVRDAAASVLRASPSGSPSKEPT